MPRRLGDDPLARARNERANAAASATASSESGAQVGLAQPGIQFSSYASYNDVFYQIRAEGGDAAIAGTPQQVAEAQGAQEISEISEIPEIREVATLPDVQAAQDVTAFTEAEKAPENAEGAEVPPSAVMTVENPEAAKAGEPVARLAADVDAVPGAKEDRTDPQVGPQTSNLGEDRLEPEHQDGGGFIKRFFDRLGK